MAPTPNQPGAGGARRRRQRGFTLFETILVIGILTLVSFGMMSMQPQVWKAQTNTRDGYVGLELMLGCAERLLAVRRRSGYASVTSTLCNGMGGVSGFAANPTVTLVDAANATVSACASATCTATILIAKTTTPPATLAPLTLQLSAY
jgi:type II secretory pathway pseudopilin PulG